MVFSYFESSDLFRPVTQYYARRSIILQLKISSLSWFEHWKTFLGQRKEIRTIFHARAHIVSWSRRIWLTLPRPTDNIEIGLMSNYWAGYIISTDLWEFVSDVYLIFVHAIELNYFCISTNKSSLTPQRREGPCQAQTRWRWWWRQWRKWGRVWTTGCHFKLLYFGLLSVPS